MREGGNGLPQLAQSWVWAQLADVCLKPEYGWTTSASAEGALRLLRTSDITSGHIDWNTVPFCKKEPPEKEKYLLRDGDIVVSRAGSVGFSHLVRNPQEAIFASYLIRFKPLIDERYVAFFLKSPLYWEAISEKSIGIAIPNVNATKLGQIWLPIRPLAEQRRIVAKIEELFTQLNAGVTALEKARAQLRRYRQAVLKAAVEGELTKEWREAHKGELEPASVLLERTLEERAAKWEAQQLEKITAEGRVPKDDRWRKRYQEPAPPDTADLPELPEGWVWAKVSDIGEVVTGRTPSKSKPEYYGKDFPFYKPTDLNDGYHTKQAKDGLSRLGAKQARLLRAKSTLVTCIGATIGKTGFSRTEGATNQQINAVVPEKSMVPEFVYFVCVSPRFQQSIIDNASATTLPILNKTRFKDLLLPVAPQNEQQVIVEEIERRLSVADEVETALGQSMRRAERLRQSILEEAFEGKLVPQDATDEPASLLLERIKADKSRRDAEAKPRNQKQKKKTSQQLELL